MVRLPQGRANNTIEGDRPTLDRSFSMTLPKLFVVGDSISMGYGPFLERLLSGVVSYARKTGDEPGVAAALGGVNANGGTSRRVRDYLEALRAADGLDADILLLNCGLHDIARDGVDGGTRIPAEEYRENLQAILAMAGVLGVRPVWVRTTPVNSVQHHKRKPFDRLEKDVARYNASADEIMAAAGVPVCDLFRFTDNLENNSLTEGDGVHFSAEVQAQQAAFIAGYLMRLLQAQ